MRKPQNIAGLPVWHRGNTVVAVLCVERTEFEVLGAATRLHRATGTVPVFHQLPYFLLGNRIADLGNCGIDVLYCNSDEHRQRCPVHDSFRTRQRRPLQL